LAYSLGKNKFLNPSLRSRNIATVYDDTDRLKEIKVCKPVVFHVVVVDDDAKIRQALADALTDNGYRVTTVANGEQFRRVFSDNACDLLLIDLYLEKENGLRLARQIRHESDVPIIMLTGKGDETDRILGLELVADDFLMKPFNLRELLARVNALIRRSTRLGRPLPAAIDTNHECLFFDEWVLDLTGRELKDRSGRRINLTFGEYRLLEVLVRSPGRVFSRDQLLDRLHGMEDDVYDRTIDVMVLRLRRKLEPNPKKPHYILTKRGAGYFFSGEVRKT
jgi:two-component system OmpR family response regulator